MCQREELRLLTRKSVPALPLVETPFQVRSRVLWLGAGLECEFNDFLIQFYPRMGKGQIMLSSHHIILDICEVVLFTK